MLFYLSLIETDEERDLFTDLYNEYRQPMLLYAYTILKNQQDAEDVVHDVFCIVADSYIKKLLTDSAASRKHFLLVCIKNRSVTLAKRRTKTVSFDELSEIGYTFPSEAEEIKIIDDEADKEMIEKAKSALLGLDRLYSDILWLSFKGFTASDIAKLFNEKSETIKKRIYRGKLMLRDAVGMKGGEI